jgi:hypothetical protein
MRYALTAGVALAVTAQIASADQCVVGAKEIGGNWYCQAVKAITYSGIGAPGTYNEVVSMESNGKCASKPHPYKGPLAPIDDEVCGWML